MLVVDVVMGAARPGEGVVRLVGEPGVGTAGHGHAQMTGMDNLAAPGAWSQGQTGAGLVRTKYSELGLRVLGRHGPGSQRMRLLWRDDCHAELAGGVRQAPIKGDEMVAAASAYRGVDGIGRAQSKLKSTNKDVG